MVFEFATAQRIIFGPGVIQRIGTLTANLGWRVFFVCGRNLDRARPILENLAAEGVAPTVFMVDREPTVDIIQAGVTLARQNDCDVVIGFGGGSVIDSGKAIAALLTNPGEPLDYLEVVGAGQPLREPPKPFIAVPTTSGTGSEVTRNAVIGVPDRRVKVSLRSPMMLPDLAVVDPELTLSLPPDITAYSGLDALTQLIEAYVSIASNPLTDAFCRQGITHAARSLGKVYKNGNDLDARTGMSLASLLGGLALANAKLGAVHGFAGPLGGMFSAPHGALCACLLPFVMEINIQASGVREPDNRGIVLYQDIAQMLTGDPSARASEGVRWVKDICATFQIPALSNWGVTENDFGQIMRAARNASSMKGNPIRLNDDELNDILLRAF